jgi:hypothetical protein
MSLLAAALVTQLVALVLGYRRMRVFSPMMN